MRKDISFNAEGTTLRGWLYLPDDFTGPLPAVVLAHGFSAVKEMHLDRFAEAFAAAGLAALVFDHRGFGASDGEVRQEIDPVAQIRDYRHALSYAATLPEVDAQRLGVWGTSYSGGHAIVVGAIDRRVKCVVSQAPLISGWRNVQRLVRADLLPGLRAMCDADRAARFAGQPPTVIPVVTNDPMTPCALPTADSWQWFTETAQARAPGWRNELTLRSFEMLMEYEPGTYVDRISPTPLLMIVAKNDHLTVADEALAAYERALQPKQLVMLPGGHFDAYGNGFERASSAACAWFREHLAAP
jgi:uncharacterized protein